MSHPTSRPLDADELAILKRVREHVAIEKIADAADVSVATIRRLLRGEAATRAVAKAVAGAAKKLASKLPPVPA
jgi:DeoR/GlpR family transcriptional regulator of sugar metabolism